MMNRTFHQKFNMQGLVMLLILAAVGLWCFLRHEGLMPLVGLGCLLLGAATVDRLVNSSYTFTADGMLIIERGRLGKRLTIPVEQILKATPCRGTLFVASHIVIEYGIGHVTYAQPQTPEAFIREIKRRQEEYDNVYRDNTHK